MRVFDGILVNKWIFVVEKFMFSCQIRRSDELRFKVTQV